MGMPGGLVRDLGDWLRNCHRTPRRRFDCRRGAPGAAVIPHFVVASARRFQTIPVMMIAAPANTKPSSGSP